MALPPLIRDPLKLCPCVRKLYLELMIRGSATQLVLIETIRGIERQKHYVKIGVSWTLNSKHLPQPPNGLALAFDVCPKSYLKEKLWNPLGELWDKLGDIGLELGLNHGVWRKSGKGKLVNVDKPHFFLDECKCPEED